MRAARSSDDCRGAVRRVVIRASDLSTRSHAIAPARTSVIAPARASTIVDGGTAGRRPGVDDEHPRIVLQRHPVARGVTASGSPLRFALVAVSGPPQASHNAARHRMRGHANRDRPPSAGHGLRPATTGASSTSDSGPGQNRCRQPRAVPRQGAAQRLDLRRRRRDERQRHIRTAPLDVEDRLHAPRRTSGRPPVRTTCRSETRRTRPCRSHATAGARSAARMARDQSAVAAWDYSRRHPPRDDERESRQAEGVDDEHGAHAPRANQPGDDGTDGECRQIRRRQVPESGASRAGRQRMTGDGVERRGRHADPEPEHARR